MNRLNLTTMALALALCAAAPAEARPNDPMLGLQIATQGNQALEAIREQAQVSFRAQVPALPRPQPAAKRVAGGSPAAASVRCAE